MPPTVAYYYDEEIGALVLGKDGERQGTGKKRGRMFGKPMLMLAQKSTGLEKSSMR